MPTTPLPCTAGTPDPLLSWRHAAAAISGNLTCAAHLESLLSLHPPLADQINEHLAWAADHADSLARAIRTAQKGGAA